MVTLSRLGRKRRLVLMLEWLTLCPTCAVLPVSSHRRDIEKPYPSTRLPDRASAHCQRFDHLRFRKPATYKERMKRRQAACPGAIVPRMTEGYSRRTPIALIGPRWRAKGCWKSASGRPLGRAGDSG